MPGQAQGLVLHPAGVLEADSAVLDQAIPVQVGKSEIIIDLATARNKFVIACGLFSFNFNVLRELMNTKFDQLHNRLQKKAGERYSRRFCYLPVCPSFFALSTELLRVSDTCDLQWRFGLPQLHKQGGCFFPCLHESIGSIMKLLRESESD